MALKFMETAGQFGYWGWVKPDHKHTPEAGPEFKVLIHYYVIPYLMQNTSTPHGSKRSTPLGVKSKRQKCLLPRKWPIHPLSWPWRAWRCLPYGEALLRLVQACQITERPRGRENISVTSKRPKLTSLAYVKHSQFGMRLVSFKGD